MSVTMKQIEEARTYAQKCIDDSRIFCTRRDRDGARCHLCEVVVAAAEEKVRILLEQWWEQGCKEAPPRCGLCEREMPRDSICATCCEGRITTNECMMWGPDCTGCPAYVSRLA